MPHYIIINGVRVKGPHEPHLVATDDTHESAIEFGDIKYSPAHDLTPEQQGKEVTRILKKLYSLGDSD